MKHRLIAFLAVFLLAGNTYAQSEDDSDNRRERRGPPPAALEACASLVQGDACTFEGRRGETMEGLCAAPSDKALACRPEGGRQKRERQQE